MRSDSVFAGQTRTNQPSCAVAAVAMGTPIIAAIKDPTKNARIRPPESRVKPVGLPRVRSCDLGYVVPELAMGVFAQIDRLALPAGMRLT